MRRHAKPAKAKVEGNRPPPRKPPKTDDPRVRDLEKRLAEAVGQLQTRDRDLAEAQEQQTATSEILRVISSSPTDYQPVFDTIVRRAGVVCGAVDAMLWTVDGDELVVRAHHGPLRAAIGGRQPIQHGSVAGYAVREAQIVHVEDLTGADDFPVGRDIARRLGWRTTLSAPLLREGVAIGAILIRRSEVRPFTGKQIALLKTFADQAVIAIENVRMFTELGEKNRALTEAHAQVTEALDQQTATSEILRVISGSPTDLHPVFDSIAASALRLCDAKLCTAFRFDGELIHLVGSRHVSEDGAAAYRDVYPSRPGRQSGTHRAILTRTIVHIPDIREDAEYELRALARANDYGCVLAVPMLRDGDAVGAITVGREASRPFTNAQIELLKTFADQAVIAIENVRLFTELQEKNHALTEALDRQTATGDVLRIIAKSPTELQPVLEAIAASAVRLCSASDVVVERLDGNRFYNAAHAGQQIKGVVGLPLPLTRGFPGGRAVLERSPIIIDDIMLIAESEYPDTLDLLRLNTIHSVAEVPLLSEGKPLGSLAVLRAEVRPFTETEVALLSTFADQAVIAIENVRLFKELEARNRDLTESLDRETATGEILRVISSSPTDIEPVLGAILDSGRRLCDAEFGAIFRFENDAFVNTASTTITSEFGAWLQHNPIRPGEGTPLRRVARERRPVQVADILSDPGFAPPHEYRREGMRTALAVPMLKDGALVGALTFHRRVVKPFTDQQIALLETFAAQAVIAIENVRLFTELEARNRDLTATSQILQVISRSPTDVQPVLDTVAASAALLCDAYDVSIHRVDGPRLRLMAHHGPNPSGVIGGFTLPLRRGVVVGRAALDGRTIHVADLQTAAEEFGEGSEIARQIGHIRTILAVPLMRDNAAIGTISLRRTEVRPFGDKQIALLQTFADQAVIAIENVRLFKELEARTQDLTRSVGELRALGEVGQALSSILDLETVLTTIVSRAVQLSGLDGGVVFEYDEGSEEFTQRAAAETGGVLAQARRGTRYRRGEGVLGRTAITLEPAQVPDITVPGAYDSRARENLIESGVRAILAVPMIHQGRLIGCLGVTRNRPGDFSAETIELLRTFATQSALAIQNARLFLEIADKSRQLEAASRHKSEFLANMSHELRTPLNAVIGFSEVLLQRMFGELNVKQDEYLRDIYASGQHLLSLINDILDLSKIEAGRMELAPAPFHLPSALENAVTLVRERAARHGITLEVDVDPGLGELIGDERKVKQVLLNLLSNAVKFTPEGGRISLKAVRRDGTVEIAVTDTGIGIAPEDQAAIFEEFRQVGSDETRKQEGTGLGLTLAKKFVELHGGRIWVESTPGRGSTFTFTLPVA